MASLSIDIWSDIACPWCYIGKRRLERAVAALSAPCGTLITWHAFELNPSVPRQESEGDYAARLAKNYGISTHDAQTMIDNVTAVAKGEGLDFDFTHIRPGNTFDAHRLLHMARTYDRQGAIKERFMRAYFCEGQAIGDHETLLRLAVEAGLDAATVSQVLGSDTFASEVRRDEALARELDINSVPFFVVGKLYGVSGAQPPEVLLEIMDQARSAGFARHGPQEGAGFEPGRC